MDKQKFEKKPLYIVLGLKGGLGKSKIAKLLLPCIIYKNVKEDIKQHLKFNIVEIDDSATKDIWSSKRVKCNCYDVADYKDAIIQIQRTFNDKNIVEIIDLGSGGEKVKHLLSHISKMRLEDLFDINFIVPVTRDSLIFDSTKTTLELIHSNFNKKSTLIYNRVIENLEEEFQTYFGYEKWDIKSRYDEIENLIQSEWVIYEDRLSLFENAINYTKKSALDFYIYSNRCIENFTEDRTNAINNPKEFDRICTSYDVAFDFIDFFKRIQLNLKRD